MDRKNTEAIQSRKAQLIADLAVARAGLRRDVGEVRQLTTISGQLRFAFKGNGGKAVAASMAVGSAIANFFGRKKQGRSDTGKKQSPAGSILTDGVNLLVDFLLKKGVDRYLEKEWQRTAARGILAVLGRR